MITYDNIYSVLFFKLLSIVSPATQQSSNVFTYTNYSVCQVMRVTYDTKLKLPPTATRYTVESLLAVHPIYITCITCHLDQ